MASSLPSLVVFDLDYTLWPFWVDTHTRPPFKKIGDQIFDTAGKKINCYPEVPQVLESLKNDGVLIGIASRTHCVKEAKQLVELFEWHKFITYSEIYPGSKVNNFNRFHEEAGIAFEDMLFFDDEHRNILDLKKLGVTSIFVNHDHGVSLSVLHEGLRQFSSKKRKP